MLRDIFLYLIIEEDKSYFSFTKYLQMHEQKTTRSRFIFNNTKSEASSIAPRLFSFYTNKIELLFNHFFDTFN